MIATVQFKRRMAGACVFGIIISKLSHCWEPSPIILFEIDKSLKVGVYDTVLLFVLANNLQIEGGKKPMLDVEEIAER